MAVQALQLSAGILVLSLVASLAAACSFQPECRPGESYRVAIPCEGKCSSYFQCSDGVATEKACGRFLWRQNVFDAATLDCGAKADCDWWKKIVTTSTSAPVSTTISTTTETTTTVSSTTSTEASPEPTTATSEAPQPQHSTAVPTMAPAVVSEHHSDSSGAALHVAASALIPAALALLL